MGTGTTQAEAATNESGLSVDVIQFLPNNLQWYAQIVIFLIALFGALPHYRDMIVAYVRGVPVDQLSQGEEQSRLWEKNSDCYKQSNPVPVKTNRNDALSVTVCPKTGDILVDVKPSEGAEIFKWIGLNSFEKTGASILSSSTAFAQPVPQGGQAQVPATVLCQRQLSGEIILRRVQYSDGQCFDQQINPFSQQVVQRNPAPCDQHC
jgi:hypothetical protein